MTNPFSLADGFQTPDFADWEALAQKALKGAPLERFNAMTLDGLLIKPLYRAADLPQGATGPTIAVRDPFLPWDIRQIVGDSAPARANEVALYDLVRGVSSIEFRLDPKGLDGVAVQTPQDAQTLVRGFLLDLATLALDAPKDPLTAAHLIADAVPSAQRDSAKIAFNLDPFGQMMRAGPPLTVAAALDFASQSARTFPGATSLRADSRPIHDGGGSDAQELAVAIAAGLAYLKAGESAGMGAQGVNQTLLFTLSVGPDVVLEIAKLKAARRLWAGVMQACGVDDAPMKLQAVTSARMQTIADPWTNIVRATCAAFAAGAGGADSVTVLPFTSAYAPADEQARRIARNTQLILQEETYLGRVADPAAGAYAMEAIADDLAKAAWALVQEIERAGGLEAALTQGLVQGWVAGTRAKREADIARRKTALVGVSVFPNLGENLPSPPEEGERGGVIRPQTIPPMRLSAPYEALRARSNGAIFLATLGPIAKFSARSGFARNAFEAGGIKALGGDDAHEGDQAIIAAFTKSGAKIACLCGDDETYQTRAAPLAQALKHAGAKVVWLAGKGDFQSVDRTIFAGANILAELTFAHAVLEGAQ